MSSVLSSTVRLRAPPTSVDVTGFLFRSGYLMFCLLPASTHELLGGRDSVMVIFFSAILNPAHSHSSINPSWINLSKSPFPFPPHRAVCLGIPRASANYHSAVLLRVTEGRSRAEAGSLLLTSHPIAPDSVVGACSVTCRGWQYVYASVEDARTPSRGLEWAVRDVISVSNGINLSRILGQLCVVFNSPFSTLSPAPPAPASSAPYQ